MAFTFSPHSMQRHQVTKEGRRVYIVRYLAITDQPGVEGPVACRQAYDAYVPLGSGFTYYSDTDAGATRTRAFDVIPWRQGGQGEAARFWVDATFDTGDATNCSTESFEGAPWTHPWRRAKVNTRITRDKLKDKDGNPLTKTNGNRYDPPLQVEYIESHLELTGNIQGSALDVNTWALYEQDGGALNNAIIGSFGAQTLRVSELTWNEAFYGVCERYYECRATFMINPNGHALKVPQFGWTELDGADFRELGWNEPVALDANGKGAAVPFEKTHEVYPELAYPPPGIPASLFTF